MRTVRPARARVIAAASPFGPAPTTIASSRSPVAGLISPSGRGSPAAGDPADRGGHRPSRRPHGGAVPDVPPVAPLAAAVDAADLDRHDRLGHAEPDRQVAHGRLPELVVLAVPAELVRDLVERIRRPFER